MEIITLSPKDVPGACLFPGREIIDHTVEQLKRWLEVRGLKRTGKKLDLAER
jgi:hypothetical protein